MTAARRAFVSAFTALVSLIVLHMTAPSARAADPLRVVLLIDSSTTMAPMLTEFRAGLQTFIDGLPPQVEVALISTGGQLRIRVAPTTDREQLHKGAAMFASDGGANALLDTLLESDKRFLKSMPDRRPIFVVISTDQLQRGEPRIDDYNAFMRDFVRRRGRAHAVVIRGSNMGVASEILENLTTNTDGLYSVMAVGNSLPNKMREIAEQVAAQE
jgi:hypothetical protein